MSRQGLVGRATLAAERLPMPRIVAWMLGASAAFFALAMPPRVLGRLMGSVGLPGGLIGRILFTTLFTALLAWVGWRALTSIANRTPRPVKEPEVELEFESAPSVRRRPIGVIAPEAPIALRRGDAHPDAPPRRPIFAAHELGAPVLDERHVPAADEAGETEFVLEPPEPEAAPSAADEALVEAEPAPEAEAEPLELQTPLDLVHSIGDDEAPGEEAAEAREPAPYQPSSIASLIARLEGGLERLDGNLPPPPEKSAVTPLKFPSRENDDALREALAALQRMAARQH